jgi:hypothetical protein
LSAPHLIILTKSANRVIPCQITQNLYKKIHHRLRFA